MATLNFSHFVSEEVGGGEEGGGGLVFSMFGGYFTFVERLPQLQLYAVACVMRWNLALYSTNIVFLDSWKRCIFQLYKPWTLHKTRENLSSHFDGIRWAALIPWTKRIVVRDSCDLKHLEGGKLEPSVLPNESDYVILSFWWSVMWLYFLYKKKTNLRPVYFTTSLKLYANTPLQEASAAAANVHSVFQPFTPSSVSLVSISPVC